MMSNDDDDDDDEDERFRCPYSSCPRFIRPFRCGAHLREHVESVHLKIKHPCCVCGKELSTISAVKRHIRNMHSKNC